MKLHKAFFLTGLALAFLSGCTAAKEELGLVRQAPDEFTVIKRAPLALPPDYTLRPPQPGAPRPQEQSTQEQVREVVFGREEKVAPSKADGAEAILLQQTGAATADPSIRSVVDRETAALEPRQKPVVKKLLGMGKEEQPATTIVNAPAEAERLKQNKVEGKPVTTGETPTLEE